MTNKRIFLGLDVGTKRIGVATADSIGRIAQPLATVNAAEPQALQQYLHDLEVTDLVVGRPRNQAGDTTEQTQSVERFVATLPRSGYNLHWQDESVTSVIAEDRLKARKKPYTKADIDAEAATIILQDFLESL